jgi:hypothetical protein
MSLFVATHTPNGIVLVTDSAASSGYPPGQIGPIEKVWRLDGTSIRIAACGNLALAVPPSRWPMPAEVDFTSSFERIIDAIHDQMDGLTEATYDLLVVGVQPETPKRPLIAKLTRAGVERPPNYSILLGGFSKYLGGSGWAPKTPTLGLGKCRDLVIAGAAMAIRNYRTAPEKPPAIAFPLHLYTWAWAGAEGTDFRRDFIDESATRDPVRRHFAFTQASESAPKLIEVVSARLMDDQERLQLPPEALSVQISVTVTTTPRVPSVKPSDPVTGAPIETP